MRKKKNERCLLRVCSVLLLISFSFYFFIYFFFIKILYQAVNYKIDPSKAAGAGDDPDQVAVCELLKLGEWMRKCSCLVWAQRAVKHERSASYTGYKALAAFFICCKYDGLQAELLDSQLTVKELPRECLKIHVLTEVFFFYVLMPQAMRLWPVCWYCW